MPYKPMVGVPYHSSYANAAFAQCIQEFEKFGFSILQLDCHYFNNHDLRLSAKKNINLIDGLLIPGNPKDIHPKFYNETLQDFEKIADDRLFLYQRALFLSARNLGMPILGICAGSYVINVALGGKLQRCIFSHGDPSINHNIDPRKGELAHSVTVLKGTHLHDILSGPEKKDTHITMTVNSWHDSVNNALPPSLIASAESPDNLIEAIEEKFPGNPNCFGIQFHPEYLHPEKNKSEFNQQRRIIEAFRKSSIQFHFMRQMKNEIEKPKEKKVFLKANSFLGRKNREDLVPRLGSSTTPS